MSNTGQYNQVDTVAAALGNPDVEKVIFDAVLDDGTPVKVLCGVVNVFGDVAPLAILLTEDLVNRVSPADEHVTAETHEETLARITGEGAA